MDINSVCKECGKMHHLPDYHISCQFCQKSVVINSRNITRGKVSICDKCQKRLMRVRNGI